MLVVTVQAWQGPNGIPITKGLHADHALRVIIAAASGSAMGSVGHARRGRRRSVSVARCVAVDRTGVQPTINFVIAVLGVKVILLPPQGPWPDARGWRVVVREVPCKSAPQCAQPSHDMATTQARCNLEAAATAPEGAASKDCNRHGYGVLLRHRPGGLRAQRNCPCSAASALLLPLQQPRKLLVGRGHQFCGTTHVSRLFGFLPLQQLRQFSVRESHLGVSSGCRKSHFACGLHHSHCRVTCNSCSGALLGKLLCLQAPSKGLVRVQAGLHPAARGCQPLLAMSA
mmetsp:Transcript_55048/g.170476  ORF Transcript_55048/g.170476 Transcript_55048/m.170476 type:complete len:286 (+) Transcript_55048:188-1045(+)